MNERARLPVVLLWHMHQPQYRDALTGEYVYPWTLLHAIKDYSDMAAHLEDNPAARAVVNFTPVLIEQIIELSEQVTRHLRQGTDLPDPVLALLSDVPLPEDRTRRLDLMRAVMRAQRAQVIEPLPVFAELVDLATHFATPERVAYASDDLLTDLGVWYHLAWTGETIRRRDPRIGQLMARGRAFRLEERRMLLALIGETLSGIIPRYRALAERGRVEIAVSPYGHPILPLLCSFETAREALPSSALPSSPNYPGGRERSKWHLDESVRMFTELFGRRPVGCWPSEGAISDEALDLIDSAGFGWVASSANVLRNSLRSTSAEGIGDDGDSAFNRPYALPQHKLAQFYRHDTLSDLVGFTYATWHGDDATNHLVHELAQLADRYSEDRNGETRDRVILIALDGENAWEHYPQNGYHFLRALYARLADHPALELTTLADIVARNPERAPIRHVMAGSWVHGTLSTWMGDRDKNAAWDWLCTAKREYDRVVAEGTLDAGQREAAMRQLALCESSDWFWWFGDYNPAEAVTQFDQLFRRQLTTLYRLLQLEVPFVLTQPLSVGRGAPEGGGVMRRASAS